MKTISFTNQRITSRNELNIKGILHIKSNNLDKKEDIIIKDISLNGIQTVFSNDDFLFYILESDKIKSYSLTLEFSIENYSIKTQCIINWIRIFDIGEKNFYVSTGLNYENFNEVKEQIISLILDINMKNFFFPKDEKIEESLIG